MCETLKEIVEVIHINELFLSVFRMLWTENVHCETVSIVPKLLKTY